jgi:hypothetical protein
MVLDSTKVEIDDGAGSSRDGAAALIQGALRSAGFVAAVEDPAGCAPFCEVPAR